MIGRKRYYATGLATSVIGIAAAWYGATWGHYESLDSAAVNVVYMAVMSGAVGAVLMLMGAAVIIKGALREH